ncbi:MAG: sensor histidine kinase [Candidatus Paceibacterota bacterium]
MVKRKVAFLFTAVFFLSVVLSSVISTALVFRKHNSEFKASFRNVIENINIANDTNMDVFKTLNYTFDLSEFNFYSAFSVDGSDYTWLNDPLDLTNNRSPSDFYESLGGRYTGEIIDLKTGGYLMIIGDKGNIFSQVELFMLVAVSFSLVLLLFMLLFVVRYSNKLLGPISYISNLSAENVSSNTIVSDGMDSDFTTIVENYRLLIKKSELALEAEIAARNHLTNFITSASHELRTPLTVIIGYTELMRDGTKTENVEWIESIHREALRLAHLVNSLLSSVESGLVKDEQKQVINVRSVLEERLTSILGIQPERVVTVKLSPCNIFGDKESFLRVTDNILSNIVKYTDSTSPVNVSSYCEEGVCFLIFEDTGLGSFAEGTINLGSNGLGKGIINECVSSLGGSVTYLKNDFGGLSVTVALPCVNEEHPES